MSENKEPAAELDGLYRNRVLGLEYHAARDLEPHPKNPRTHPDSQVRPLRGILGEVGKADRLLAYRSPRTGLLTLIDGHARRDDRPDEMWPVLVLDLDDEEAAKLLAVLHPIASLAGSDEKKIEELLAEIEVDDEALGELLEKLAPKGKSLPEPGDAQVLELPEKWDVLVECNTEDEQKRALAVLAKEGISCRALIS